MKKMFVLLFVASNLISFAQSSDNHEIKSFEGDDGKLYWNKKLPVYINISSNPNEKGHELKSKVHAEYTNPFYFDTDGINYIRTRYAVDKNTKKTVNPHIELLWEVYTDGTSPKTVSKFKGAQKIYMNNSFYYGEGLTVSLSSNDKLSGVENIYYSMDGSEFKKYTSEIKMESNSEEHILRYYAVDNVGNVEDVRVNQKIFL